MRKRRTASPTKGGESEKVSNSMTSPPRKAYLDVRLRKNVVKRVPVEDRIATLTESIRCNLFDSQLYYQRGILYFNSGKTTDALNDFNRSIKINPRFVKAYYARAELLVALNNQRLALIDLEKAMELEGPPCECDLNPVTLKEKKATILLHSAEQLENYLLRLTETYIESGNDLSSFFDLMGIDKSDYDFNLLQIEPKDMVSVIMGTIDEKSNGNQLLDFINMSDGQNEMDLWDLFYRFLDR